ncbi:MAG: hypothetical protein R3E42_14715 [Burkholderiaceae bacterium]
MNQQRAKVDLVILVSDNESWVDARRAGATQTLIEWEKLKQRCPQARLVCIDIQPGRTTQAVERADILNVGGFSDAVFTMLAQSAQASCRRRPLGGRDREGLAGPAVSGRKKKEWKVSQTNAHRSTAPQVARAGKPAAENPQTALVNLVACDTNQPD